MRRSRYRHSEFGEASTLETDAIRFVAIVGLTLMVIFALVHSLPYKPEVPEVEAVALQEIPPEPEPEPELRPDHMALLSAELDRTRHQLTLARQRIAELEAVPVPVPAPEPEPEPAPEPEVVAPVVVTELLLRFKDDAVYLDLLSRERIRSYLHIPELDLTYRVRGAAGDRLRFSLVYDLEPGKLYKIPDSVLPEILVRETRRFDIKLSMREDLDYLVILSERIGEQVSDLETRGTVGQYDILASEEVVPTGVVQ